MQILLIRFDDNDQAKNIYGSHVHFYDSAMSIFRQFTFIFKNVIYSLCLFERRREHFISLYQCHINLLLHCFFNNKISLCFVYEDYNSSYEELLQKAKVSSLQIRRMRTMALETYKIINKLAPVCLHELVHMKNSKYSFRYNNILEIPQIKSTWYGKNLSDLLLLRFAAPTLWNSLPDHFRTEIAFLNSRVFCSPGMGPIVAVLHVDDYNFASGLLI